MSVVTGYLPWAFGRRVRLQLSKKEFSASMLSYADKSCHFEAGVKLYKGACLYDTHLGVGSYSWARMVRVRVGRFCSIGRAEVGGQGRHPTRWLSTHPAFYSPLKESGFTFAAERLYDGTPRLTIVGNDVWIGHGAVVMEGCEIGDGAIVAASAVVTKNVEPYSIVGGIPAKLIRHRFSPDVVEILREWQWWNLPLNEIERLAPQFCTTENWTADMVSALQQRSSLGSSRKAKLSQPFGS